MSVPLVGSASGLCAFIDASPSPFHVCATVAAELTANGFTELAQGQPWSVGTGRYFVVRGGSLVAWVEHEDAVADPARAFRVVGAHTDSPNLRVKQQPDAAAAGWQLVALEPYGGAWLDSWLDLDLGLSGRLVVNDGTGLQQILVHLDEPLLRVPRLAIHLASDRQTVTVDPQRHLTAVWGTGERRSLVGSVAQRLDVDAELVLGWELMVHDLAPSLLTGRDRELVSAPRLDNQTSCYAGLRALLAAADQPAGVTPVVVMFDHEEVGSGSDRGAESTLLPAILERIVLARTGGRSEYLAALANSVCASADMAHATHPNFPERHEGHHWIHVGGGPVLKVNQNLRYASDAVGAGVFGVACAQAGVGMQRYVHRADLRCGSTIGPMVAATTGMCTVDVGAPQLAMHSARELMGAADVASYCAALAAFLVPTQVAAADTGWDHR